MLELAIVILDDDPSDLARLKGFVRNYFDASPHKLKNIASYSSGGEMLKTYEPKSAQIAFIDIIMKNINGLETARQLRAQDPALLIVLTTTSREYAFDAFTVHPFDYIVKPFAQKDVSRVIDEALRTFSANDPAAEFKISRGEYTIPFRAISSAVAGGHRVELQLTDGRNIAVSMTFHEVEEILLCDSRFLVCNRGVIVNMSDIAALDEDVFVMKTGARYPIRRKTLAKTSALFSKYLIANMRAEFS